MRLTELEPQFQRIETRREIGKFLKPGVDPYKFQQPGFAGWSDEDFEEREHDAVYYVHVENLAEADCVSFLHPHQFVLNKGPVGTMQITVWFEGRALWGDINRNGQGQYVRWSVTGTGYSDLTTKPSILICGNLPPTDPQYWHGYITDGEVHE